MKVLHVFNELKFSGAEVMYCDAASLFQQKGCELSAMATSEKIGEFASFFKDANFKLLHRPYPKTISVFRRIKFYSFFIRLIKQQEYDIVHIHRSDAMWGLSFCSWLAKKKSVYTFHNVFKSRRFTFLYHCLLRWTAKFLFNCKFQTISDSVYNNELLYYRNKTTKIYNWYSNNRYYPASSGEKLKARIELGISENALVVISVGGCSKIKRHSQIIRALPQVVEACEDSLYLHMGEGSCEGKEQALAKELRIDKNIRFCGNQTNLRKYLIASDIYLMTSIHEGIPITTIEALASCIPAILYDVPGLRDFNKIGKNCILINQDFRLLAKSILSLKDDAELRREISSNGKTFVNSHFSMQKNVELIYNLYQ